MRSTSKAAIRLQPLEQHAVAVPVAQQAAGPVVQQAVPVVQQAAVPVVQQAAVPVAQLEPAVAEMVEGAIGRAVEEDHEDQEDQEDDEDEEDDEADEDDEDDEEDELEDNEKEQQQPRPQRMNSRVWEESFQNALDHFQKRLTEDHLAGAEQVDEEVLAHLMGTIEHCGKAINRAFQQSNGLRDAQDIEQSLVRFRGYMIADYLGLNEDPEGAFDRHGYDQLLRQHSQDRSRRLNTCKNLPNKTTITLT